MIYRKYFPFGGRGGGQRAINKQNIKKITYMYIQLKDDTKGF